MEQKVLKIKLVKSPIARKPHQSRTIKALGLIKINQIVTKEDNDAIRGMIAAVSHLVEVVE